MAQVEKFSFQLQVARGKIYGANAKILVMHGKSLNLITLMQDEVQMPMCQHTQMPSQVKACQDVALTAQPGVRVRS